MRKLKISDITALSNQEKQAIMILVEDPKTDELRDRLSELQFEVIMEQDAPIMSTVENYRNWLEEENISLPLKDNIEGEGIEIEI